MKKTQRKEKILHLLQADTRVSVQALSEQLGVSAVTIRTDLSQLEHAGLLYRTHGGAVCDSATQGTAAFAEPTAAAKQAVAQAALGLIQKNTWIFLGSGSTCLALAHCLVPHAVNVVTNNLDAAQVLAHSTTAQVLMPGGSLFACRYPFLYGDMLHTALDSIVLDQAFLGVSGIDERFGFSLSNAVECSTFAKLRQISKELIVLADFSKFGKTSFMGAGTLTIADAILTAGAVPAQYEAICAQAGVALVKAGTP